MNFFNEDIKDLTVKNLRQDENDWLIDLEFTISNGIDTYKGMVKNIVLCSTNSKVKFENTERVERDICNQYLTTIVPEVLLNINNNQFRFKNVDYHNLCDLERISE